MSEFDKEAEREKLREQLEAEQADREATQRMSELLLGGATMTGKHCNDCASPIFRQNGREFCPTCNRAVGETPQSQADPKTITEADDQPTAETTDGADGADRTVDATGGSHPQVAPSESTTRDQPEATEPTSATEGAESASAPNAGGSAPTPDAGEVSVPEESQYTAPGGGDGDLAAARDALARKLTRLAAQAEATDDVGRARELLAATREAAEALAAMEGVRDGR